MHLNSCRGLFLMSLLSASWSVAHAVVLDPGKVVDVPEFDGLLEGDFVEQKTDLVELKDADGKVCSKGLVFSVITKKDGKLQFYYVLRNDASSMGKFVRLGLADFTGCKTDVDADKSPHSDGTEGSIFPGKADRSNDGKFVNFVFSGAPKEQRVLPGDQSARIRIKTDATQYQRGAASFRDDKGCVGFTQTLVPQCVAPEPGSMIAMAVGALALVRRKRA